MTPRGALLPYFGAALEQTGTDGVIATNTTISREGLRSPLATEQGGLSGAALTRHAARPITNASSAPLLGYFTTTSPDFVARPRSAAPSASARVR